MQLDEKYAWDISDCIGMRERRSNEIRSRFIRNRRVITAGYLVKRGRCQAKSAAVDYGQWLSSAHLRADISCSSSCSKTPTRQSGKRNVDIRDWCSERICEAAPQDTHQARATEGGANIARPGHGVAEIVSPCTEMISVPLRVSPRPSGRESRIAKPHAVNWRHRVA